jgi:hypothetical protein
MRMRRFAVSSIYLTEPYVTAVLPHDIQVTSKLFQLERVEDTRHVTRILSLEYLLQQFAGKVRDDFQSSSIRTHRSASGAGSATARNHASAMPIVHTP